MAPPAEHEGFGFVLANIIQDFMRFMHETGLSRPQIHALLHIYHAGECRVSDLRALSDSSPAAASQLVDRLVHHGLVQRTEDPQNRRIKRLRLTDKGLQLINRGITSNRSLANLLAALTPEQRRTVHAAFGYLAQASQVHSSRKRKEKQHASNA